jgi:uncharacterized protein YecA (UPF0149 family)
MEEYDELCEKCGKRNAIKTDGDSKLVCHHCAVGLPEPYHKPKTQHRNDKCACDSGKKFKHCCMRNP